MDTGPVQLILYDTTLRDGAQQEGISYSLADKLRITRKLDEIGIHYIEGGWPGSNPKDTEFFAEARKLRLTYATLAAFGSTRRAGIPVNEDPQIRSLLGAETRTVTLFGKSWDLHVLRVLETTLDENLRMIAETVGYLKAQGREVIYDAEHFFDGYKANRSYALETLRAAQEAGADCIVLCDTNGGSLPEEIHRIVADVRQSITVPLGIHAHNDGELAVANSLAAVRAGVVHIQGTINGFGERCGNANLCSLIPTLQLKMGYRCITDQQLRRLASVSRYVSEIANMPPDPRLPYVGRSAFTHKGGVHVHAWQKCPESYQHIDPAWVGNLARTVVSELSGRANILEKAREFGVEINAEEVPAILQRVKELEKVGFQFDGAEASLELLLRRARPDYWPPFELIDFHVLVENRKGRGIIAEATVKVRVKGEVMHTAAEGNGPVHALDLALRKALVPFYPPLAEVHLTDYKVRILNGGAGTAAIVRVLIESARGERVWSTVGSSTNIIEASWQALADSMEYALFLQDPRELTTGG